MIKRLSWLTPNSIGLSLIRLLRRHPEGLTKRQIRRSSAFASLDHLVEAGIVLRQADHRHTLSELGQLLDLDAC